VILFTELIILFGEIMATLCIKKCMSYRFSISKQISLNALETSLLKTVRLYFMG
jgi:hypothetical protein